ncbi:MAG: hypothetical protein ABJO09_12250 [Hyphomicrobiales bacterium]
MLDFELQERLKQHKSDPEQDRRRTVVFSLVFLAAGILAGIAGTYLYQRFSAPSYEAEINLMVVLAAESQNLDPAATAKAVENAVGKPIEEFSERDSLAAFKYLIENTKRN